MTCSGGGWRASRGWGLCFFFFSSRRRHTRYIGDWSSDVCSSDLTSVDREVDDDLFDLALVGAYQTQVWSRTKNQLDIFPDQASQHLENVTDYEIQI